MAASELGVVKIESNSSVSDLKICYFLSLSAPCSGVTAELFEEVSADQDGDQNSVLGLLNRGADPNGLSLARTHPLYEAAKNGFLGCVKQLLKAGAEVNALNGDVGKRRPCG